ncbi:class I SAM-dependent methyltransferase [Glycomyces sp. NPDC046736]|uniref:class I SAM-dependent methyltransferase n=1 Tax=Glycomyces sp. NPDC046736 TaxID=3155615 RepID=UPI0033CF6A95
MDYETLKADLRRAYDAEAASRAVMDDEPWKAAERERFAAYLPASARLLEIGAGHGVSGLYFAGSGHRVTCVDLSPELVARCREQGLDAEVMDFADLDYPEAAFDAVFGMNCLLHVPSADLPAVLAELARVLAPGGLCYWGQYGGLDFEGVWDRDKYEPKRFFSFQSLDRLRAFASAAFTVLDARTVPVDRTPDQFHSLILRKD